jgi:nucleoside-diphosphate-sugar epimerase
MNILITGATGFIGKNLVEELSKDKNNNIFCIVRSEQKAKLIEKYGVKFIYANISNFEDLKNKIPEKIDLIFHCAGYVSNKDKEQLYKVNVLGTENVCRLAQELKIKKLIYTSSVAVVSGNDKEFLTEDMPYKSNNAYGESKIEAEKIVLEYRDKGLKSVIVRPCMVYGSDEPHALKIFLFAIKHRIYPVLSGGRFKFHLVYVKNVVDFMIYSIDKKQCEHGTFFAVDKEVLTLREVVDIFAHALGVKPPFNIPVIFNSILVNLPFFGKRFKFFLKHREYSTEKLLKTGFQFKHKTQDALRASVLNFQP